MNNFRKILEDITRGGVDSRKVFDTFVKLSACVLSCKQREDEYMQEVRGWKKEEVGMFSNALACLIDEMNGKPFTDILGVYYMEWALGESTAKRNGEFHTPPCVCELMAKIIMDSHFVEKVIDDTGYITISEPACGAGATILAAASQLAGSGMGHLIRYMRVTATDINKTACDMCYINTTLWAIPAKIVHGNGLSGEVFGEWDNFFYKEDTGYRVLDSLCV